jgi:nitrogen-specific signal transduction histidine kinase
MLPDRASASLADQLLWIAQDPDLRRSIYERLGGYCHQCRNRLNSLKLSLYLAMKQSLDTGEAYWAAIENEYQDLERSVDRIQVFCKPPTSSRVTLDLELLFENRRDAWTRVFMKEARTLEYDPPASPAIASFDVDQIGQALDSLVEWRAGEATSRGPARLRWWLEAGNAHVVWEESRAKMSHSGAVPAHDGATWSLPLLTRVVKAHGGDLSVTAKNGWKVELSWPSDPLCPEPPGSPS